MKYLLFTIILLLFYSCYKNNKVDLIIHNGKIHIMDEKSTIAEALAIKDGRIIEVGPERQIMNKYSADIVIDAALRDVLPGFHDAHGHIISLAKQLLFADLSATRSYYEVIEELEKYKNRTEKEIIIGRGWDESKWGDTLLPTDSLLTVYFPKTPVAITRVDGHTMLVNKAMRDLSNITDTTTIDGGKLIKRNGKLTGVLIDNALSLVKKHIPRPSKEELKNKILEIQDKLLALGITHVHEAGLTARQRAIFIELASANKLKLNIYGMLYPSAENIEFAIEHGHYKKNKLSIQSFKVMVDGALGSRGACLLKPYSDQPNSNGLLLKSKEELQAIARIAKKAHYQVNFHCIGDSAIRLVLSIVDTLMKDTPDHRWRIEHAQVVHPDDYNLLASSGVLPSVQPTHAVSDYRWAEERLGKKRLKNEGYAYNRLQQQSGMILFGTDFPVESYNPFATLFAATQRKNTENEPTGGFLPEEAVSLNVALKAMTIWPSYGSFDEASVGSIEKGKIANLVICDQPISTANHYLPNYSWVTIVNGKLAFDMR